MWFDYMRSDARSLLAQPSHQAKTYFHGILEIFVAPPAYPVHYSALRLVNTAGPAASGVSRYECQLFWLSEIHLPALALSY